MCLFPFNNTNHKSEAYKKGLSRFDCGCCPECLQKKSRLWALRCCAESYNNSGIMVTLTYDNFIRDDKGKIIGETPADTRPLSVSDCQKFIKRLRKYVNDHNPNKKKLIFKGDDKALLKMRLRLKRLSKKFSSSKGMTIRQLKEYLELPKKISQRLLYIKNYNKNVKDYNKKLPPLKISYLLTAEHGKSTNRSHYHAILFGVDFSDRFFYKKSKRGNRIYRSNTLEKLWKNGICTIDAVNISGKIVRYCTKYCAKDSRGSDTFMLMSRNIGDKWLLDNFNGKSYFIDGREYAIPRGIWQKVINYKYRNNFIFNSCADERYVSLRWCIDNPDKCNGYDPYDYYFLRSKMRKHWRNFRDSNRLYKKYLEYWHNIAKTYEETRPSVLTRVLQLSNEKYFMYKQACLLVLSDIYGKQKFRYPPRHIHYGNKDLEFEKCCCYSRDFTNSLPFARPTLVIKGQMTQKIETFGKVGYTTRTKKEIWLTEIP